MYQILCHLLDDDDDDDNGGDERSTMDFVQAGGIDILAHVRLQRGNSCYYIHQSDMTQLCINDDITDARLARHSTGTRTPDQSP